jgi:O-succinylbenzoate synthase
LTPLRVGALCGRMWSLQHRVYRLPFRQTVRTAHGPWTERTGVLIRARRTREGLVETGWGEVAPIPWFGSETFEEACAALDRLEERATDLADVLARTPAGCSATRAGLAAALGDEERGNGSEADTVKFLPVAALLPAGRAALDAVESRVELGFRTFKWKVGVLPADDEQALFDDLLGRLPAGARLRLDANGAWDRRVAERWLALAAERPVEYIEQPVAPDARGAEDLLHGLAADFPVKIALDESVNGADDVARWLAADWRGVWVLKPALLGEPGPMLAGLAKAGADVVFGSALETAVGARAALRLAFAWAEARGGEPTARRALGFGVWPLFQRAAADLPLAGPFVRREDVERINPEALWNELA